MSYLSRRLRTILGPGYRGDGDAVSGDMVIGFETTYTKFHREVLAKLKAKFPITMVVEYDTGHSKTIFRVTDNKGYDRGTCSISITPRRKYYCLVYYSTVLWGDEQKRLQKDAKERRARFSIHNGPFETFRVIPPPDIPVDIRDKVLRKGQMIAKHNNQLHGGAGMEIRTVTRVADRKVYLDNSPMPVKYPGRMAILAK